MASHPLDAMSAAANHHQLLFENEEVRILDTNVPPGGQTPVHAHEWPAALYVISWSDFIRRDPDGQVMVDSRDQNIAENGAGLWLPPLPPHSIENIGTKDLRIIAVEVKR